MKFLLRVPLFIAAASVIFMFSECSQPSTSAPVINTVTAVDWTQNGFPTIADSANIMVGVADTLNSGPYTVIIPSNAFSEPVKFEILSGDTSSFAAQAPKGQIPQLAFAFNVIDIANGGLIVDFNTDVTVIVKSPVITSQSQFYNVTTDGGYTINNGGMVVQSGMLEHPIGGTAAGWVITSPVK